MEEVNVNASIDKTIDAICIGIQRDLEDPRKDSRMETAAMTEALAKLIHAKAVKAAREKLEEWF